MTKYKESLHHFLKPQKVKSQFIGPQQQEKKRKTSNMFKSFSFCLNFSDVVDLHTNRLSESITVGQVESVSVSLLLLWTSVTRMLILWDFIVLATASEVI